MERDVMRQAQLASGGAVRKEAFFFFVKKNQKTFANTGTRWVNLAHRCREIWEGGFGPPKLFLALYPIFF
jgi:hypothetical protein